TEDAQLFAEAVVRDLTGQSARGRRISRAGDQSFWGAGVPSAFMSLSGIPRQDTELSRTMERLLGTSGFPWWWHTREDTVDKIDAGVLTLDTKVYLSAALRAVNAPVLPLDHAWTARALLAVVEELRTASASRFDLAPVATAARGLVERADALATALARLAATTPGAAARGALRPPAAAQKRGGPLTIVRPTDPVSLDPHYETTAPGAWVYSNILESLIAIDEKLELYPRLATSWDVISPTRVRFKLRSGVRFHDGTPFNAAAVKFTLDRALKGTPPGRWASLAGPVAGAEVVD